MTPFRTLLLCTAAALALGSAPAREEVEALIREGNAAFAEKQFDAAVRYYERAEALASDPGLVAFNKAAALYRLGKERLREAELCLERALEDAAAPPARRARALYNLGTTLIHFSAGKEARPLARAVRALRECLRLADEGELRDNAAHNLELARQLLVRARASGSSDEPRDDPPPEQPPKQQPEEDPKQTEQPGNSGASKGRPPGKGQAWLPDPSKGKQKAAETQEQTAGRGNLQPLPDEDELQPLDARDTAAHLQMAVERIEKARRDARRLAGAPRPGVKDW